MREPREGDRTEGTGGDSMIMAAANLGLLVLMGAVMIFWIISVTEYDGSCDEECGGCPLKEDCPIRAEREEA